MVIQVGKLHRVEICIQSSNKCLNVCVERVEDVERDGSCK